MMVYRSGHWDILGYWTGYGCHIIFGDFLGCAPYLNSLDEWYMLDACNIFILKIT